MKKLLLTLTLTLFLFSCKNEIEPLHNYKESIVHDKMIDFHYNKSVLISIKDSTDVYIFKRIYVSEYDYSRFQKGDTIK